jgi:hypothetical protein
MLMKRVAELEEKLRQNSRNSHLSPSSDSPGERKQRSHDKSSSPRKRGGQPGQLSDARRRALGLQLHASGNPATAHVQPLWVQPCRRRRGAATA